MKFENYLKETASAKQLAKAKTALMKEFPDVAVGFSKGKDGVGLKVISFDKKIFLKIPTKYMGIPVYKEFQKDAITTEANLTEQSALNKIVNAMHVFKMAKKVAKLLDVSEDPDMAAEQLSQMSHAQLKLAMRKLGIK
jgi:CRISPR/Cas system Type II protein with McrA/HNH and RuvC-like nuclease domain